MAENSELMSRLSVLYIEDEEITRKAIEVILKRRVKEVSLAANGKEGLDVFLEKLPDVVITDIEMPVMNGIELIDEIRKKGYDVPIVVITAFKDESHKSDKADYNLVKPLNKQDIFDILNDIAMKMES